MDFISRTSTENQEPEENYEDEIVINAIAQLATVKVCIGRFFNQKTQIRTTKRTCMKRAR